VINSRFRESLLRNPAQALAMGYYDHTFSLTPRERDLVLDIKAQRLEDFAAQVHQWITGNGSHPEKGHDGSGRSEISRNGHGQRRNPLDAFEPLVDLCRVPVPA
jgi:hypothetical protein